MSAEALLPIASVLCSHGGLAVQDVQKALWETLDEVDDLSACAGGYCCIVLLMVGAV